MIDLNSYIEENNIGYAHSFGEKMVITAEMLESIDKSKVESKHVVTVKYKNKIETVDYLNGKDLLALKDGKGVQCIWTKSRSGKPYWNHSSTYVEDEEVA